MERQALIPRLLTHKLPRLRGELLMFQRTGEVHHMSPRISQEPRERRDSGGVQRPRPLTAPGDQQDEGVRRNAQSRPGGGAVRLEELTTHRLPGHLRARCVEVRHGILEMAGDARCPARQQAVGAIRHGI